MNRRGHFLPACSVLALASAAMAGETVTYTYDALGRLTATTSSGNVNNGVATSIAYDPAGNRSAYNVTGAGPPPPPPPAFSVQNAPAVNEGSNLQFQVNRSAGAAGTYSVNYSTSNGSAAAPDDYVPVSGTLTFTGTTSQIVSVATLADGLAEGAETVLLNLSAPTGGATVAIAQASGSINASSATPPVGNQPPLAVADSFQVQGCTAATFNPLVNDSDPNGHALTLSSVSGPAAQIGLMGIANNRLTWSPSYSTGTYSGSYTIGDGHGGTATGSFTVQVGPGGC